MSVKREMHGNPMNEREYVLATDYDSLLALARRLRERVVKADDAFTALRFHDDGKGSAIVVSTLSTVQDAIEALDGLATVRADSAERLEEREE